MVAAARALEDVDWAELLAVLSAAVVVALLAAEVVDWSVCVGALEASKLLTSAAVGGLWVAQSFWMLLLHWSWPSALPALA